MKSTRIVVAASLVVLALAVAATARAQSTVDECQARIDLIQADLDTIFDAGGIGGNSPAQTYASLSSKLDGAKNKLDQGKFAQAMQKLVDFKTAVMALSGAAKPKLSAGDAALLLDGDGESAIDEGVNGAIACVAMLP